MVFDFAFIFERPVIIADTSFDPKPYDASWLDDPIWNYEAVKAFGAQLTEDNAENIGELIRECLDSPELKAGIRKVREESWANIGHSAEKIVDYLAEKTEL